MSSMHFQSWHARCGRLLMLLAVGMIGGAVAAGGESPRELLTQSGVKGGLIVHLGCGNGSRTVGLHVGPQYVVQGLDQDASQVAAARKFVASRSIDGAVCFDRWDGRHLPYAENLVNLIIAEDSGQATRDELMRVLAPLGVLMVWKDGDWVKTVKPWPNDIDQWTHFLHGPDGNPVANDQKVGPPRKIQWLGNPRWSRHHDHMASMTSLVSSNGRLFYILDEGPRISIQLPSKWYLIARDAFNGTILWKRSIDRWNTSQYPLKSGPAPLLRRLVAQKDWVYVTLGIDSPVTVLDGATGKTLRTFAGSEFTREIVVSQGVAFLVADNSPSPLPKWQRISTYVWDNTQRANPEYGWHGTTRRVLAYDTESGKLLWKSDSPVAPCSLAADSTRVVFHDGSRLVCLNRTNGAVLWNSESLPTAIPVPTNTGPRVVIYGDIVLAAPNNGKMSAWAAEDGHKLWERVQRPTGHMSLRDLMVVNGLVWTAAIATNRMDGTFVGYDVKTGEQKSQFQPDVQLHWFHHRCYPAKAAGDYILTARNGTEYVDLVNQHWDPNHWVRGGCIYGVMPCNGLTYAPMDSCGCQLEAKLEGFKALAAGPVATTFDDGAQPPPRLEKGPAFGLASGPQADAGDWPMYRHDEGRSGACELAVPADVGKKWETNLGSQPTAPVIAAGQLFVATKENHTVHALSAETGKENWSYIVGGRVDSPPTYYRGLVLFGSADGYVYALSAGDGELAWRFRAAPIDRRLMAFQQLESAWPVHGSVLIHDGVLYCTAGRNMFVDGGIHFLRLDPLSGQLLGEVVMGDTDPVSGKEMQRAYLEKTPGNNMPVAESDILSCDGKYIWMRSQKMDFDGKRLEIGLENVSQQPTPDCHLFCPIGFLDDSYFFRGYWMFGRRMSGGYGGWMQAERLVPSGRIICFDDTHAYGFGRRPEFMVNASVLEYQLFSADKAVTRAAIDRVENAVAKINARSARKNGNSSDWLLRRFFPREDLSAAKYNWTVDQPAIMTRAMALSKSTIFIAGPPYEIDEREVYHRPNTPDTIARIRRQQQAIEGKQGGELWALAKQDGKIVGRFQLDTIPVFDGMAAAGGRLYMSTMDGRIICLAGGTSSLPPVAGRPVSVAWNQPEDPGYLIDPPESKEADFDRINACTVMASKLGYRIAAKNKERPGIALLKLDQPVKDQITLTASLKGIKDTGGLLRNGYLVLGDGAKDTQLIKCGVRLQAQNMLIVQGPLGSGTRIGKKIDVTPDGKVQLTVTVDLAKQEVRFTAGSVQLEAKLERPLQSVSFIGYAVDNAKVDFSPIKTTSTK